MGCVVFHYDMVGVADSQPIGHRQGFVDVQAELRLQNFMGLQTYNSIRALDFLLSLPDVDPQRIGVTGASGGGTQTFILCAIDDRPAAAFPAVMVSHGHAGRLHLRELLVSAHRHRQHRAGRPVRPEAARHVGRQRLDQGHRDQGPARTQGPVQALRRAEDNVMAKAHLEFGHNYNQVSREIMYNFFNKHLKLGQSEPVVERPFVPVPPKELSVFDEAHPRPNDAADATVLRNYLSATSDKQLAGLMPKDAAGLKEFRKVLRPALRVMIGEGRLQGLDFDIRSNTKLENKDGLIVRQLILSRKGAGEAIPVTQVMPKDSDGRFVVWVHPDGVASLWQDGKLVPAAQKIINEKGSILAVEVFRTGAAAKEKIAPVNKAFAGYTFGYNRPLLAERVRDILTVLDFAGELCPADKIHLVGFGKAGPWVLLARALSNSYVGRTAADLNQFSFADVTSFDDEMMLPGALKYGGLPVLAALCAPHELFVHNLKGLGSEPWLPAAYASAGKADRLRRGEKASPEDVVSWLLRKK